MEYVFIIIGATMQICFAQLFLSSFLEANRTKHTVIYTLIGAWALNTAFGMFRLQGVRSYLMYLLIVVFMLLALYGEYGLRGLSLLIFAFIIPFIIDMGVAYISRELDPLPQHLIIMGGKIILVAFSALLHIYRNRASHKEQDSDSEALLLRQNMEMQHESMCALEQSYRMQRKSAHEFEHHLQVLKDLIDQGENEIAKDYLNRLKKNRSIHLMSVSSHHPIVDVILNQKHQTALENEIKMQIQVNDLSRLQISSDCLVVILINLLDNAIEACRRIDGYREIFCTVLYDDGLFISIRNTSLPIDIKDGKIPTSKDDSLSHGFGLLSVSYMLDKLCAEYTLGYDDGWFYFTAEIEDIKDQCPVCEANDALTKSN